MLPLGHRIAFCVFAFVTLLLGARGFRRMYRRIARGAENVEPRSDRPFQRAWYALRTTLLQTRVFRKRLVLSVFHSFIFYAFVLYLVVNAVDAVDGFVDLRPVSWAALRMIYGVLTDAFSVLAIVGVIAFVVRRFVLGARRDFRFNERTLLHEDVRRGYIQRDSAIVAAFIVFHIGSRVVGNAARLATEGADRWQPFGSLVAPLFAGPHAMAWRIFGYWGALGSVLLFLVYFPYSKHVHLLMAPLKYFFAREASSGALPPEHIDLEAAELKVGAAQLADLAWPRLLDAYACIQCNRCQDVCPATQTGKALSPSALEINKRMVLNEIAGERSAFSLAGEASFEAGRSAEPKLLEAVISAEAVWGCTTCGACMQVCPTQDEQMLDIMDIRRNLVMVEGEFPAQLQSAFRGMERASNPWGLARDKRMAWAEGLHVPTVEEVADPEVLYWVGCAASYDASAQKTARAMVQLLAEAKVSFAVLGKRECCTGDSARRAGNELLYQQLATEAVGVLQQAKPKTVLASCPHCVNTIATEFPQFGGNFNVVHHTEYLAGLVDAGRLQPVRDEGRVAFHDPCYLGRHRGTYEQPRSVLKVLTNDLVEMPRNKSNGFCCGAGGAQFWKEEEPGSERVADNRFREAQRVLGEGDGGKTLAVGCPFCKSMLGSTTAAGDGIVEIRDVAELLWEGVQRAKDAAEPALSASVGLGVAAGVGIEAKASTPAVMTEATELASTTAVVAAPEVIPVADPEQGKSDGLPEGSAAPPPERKKWVPKKSAAIAEPAIPEADKGASAEVVRAEQTVVGEAVAERKKWAPKKAAVVAEPGIAEPQKVEAAEVVSSEQAVAVASTPERQKWVPKKAAAAQERTAPGAASASVSASASEVDAKSVATAEAVAPAAQSEPAVQPRKKWQPKGQE